MIKDLDTRTIRSHKKIEKLITKIKLFIILENYLSENRWTFSTVYKLDWDIRSLYEINEFSISTLFRVLKLKDMKYKSIITRFNENQQTKNARIIFYQNYIENINNSMNDYCYFDWTSFSEGNFINTSLGTKR